MYKYKFIKAIGICSIFALIVFGNMAGCGEGDNNSDDLDGTPPLNGEMSNVMVTFNNYCTDDVTVYMTNQSGSSCTLVENSTVQLPAGNVPNAFSASNSGSPECGSGTRVEFTVSSDGDVFYDISTNANQPPVFFNVPVRILAMQNTAGTSCAFPEWDGTACPLGSTNTLQCRCVSSLICTDMPTSLQADCTTGYLTPTSGPQFVCRETAVNEFIVEWCPSMNPNPVSKCMDPEFKMDAPCPNVCYEDATKAPFPCSENQAMPHEICNAAPFGGTRPESYCLLDTDCTATEQHPDRAPCGCCTDDSQCTGGDTCTDFQCK